MPESTVAPHGFPVVGIGASAGGLEALKKFFAKVPTDSRMAYVVIVHLSKDHESLLAEILQSTTRMPVRQVTETIKVEPGQVYVIPPTRNLVMVDGLIKLTDRSDTPGRRIPIDLFFRTLAEAYGKDSFAVILSGSGNDGTLGIERVKEVGGVTMVQDPEEAEFDSMPLSAISSRLIDVVLPAGELAVKIQAMHELANSNDPSRGALEFVIEDEEDSAGLRDILSLVRAKTGHDFSSYKRPTLLRRISRRLQVHEVPDMESYVKLLKTKPEEVQCLLQDLLITVTNFFRDKETFLYLEREVIPKLFEGKTAGGCVRVWSCGVGTGEEAYSLAMLLLEHRAKVTDPPKIQVFASDINEDALRIAREGCYSSAIATDVSPKRLKRFFTEKNGNYCVTKELRDLVLFAPHNVLRDPPFSQLDLIACRNLLIYLNRDTQKKVMEVFGFALNAGGYLFLGSSEGAEGSESIVETIDKKHRIYKNAHGIKRLARPIAPALGRWETKLPDSRLSPMAVSSPIELIHLRLASRYAPPSLLITSNYEIIHMSEGVDDFLQIPAGMPTSDLFKSVHPSLKLDLRAALLTANQDNKEAEAHSVRLLAKGGEKFVNLIVRPVEITGTRHYLILFDERAAWAGGGERPATVFEAISGDGAMESVVNRLEDELQEARERQRLTLEHGGIATEELKASNEELQAMNEELRSATEELETSREELQSVNEEMATVNLELKNKVEEISSSHSDLQNLMHSTDIGTIFLSRDLTIKRYTRRIEQLFNIIETDIGRPFDHVTHKFDYTRLTEDARLVLTSLQTIEREIHIVATQTSYLARLSPYRTMDERIEGVVISFVDITELKRTADSLVEREQQLRLAQEAARAGVWSLDLQTGRAWWSDEYLLLHGGKPAPAEPTMENWLKNFHPAEAEKVQREIQNAIYNRSQYIHEFKIDLPSGEHWVMEVGRAIYDENGNPLQMAGISMDVTDRIVLRQEQAALLQKKEIHEESLRDANRRKDEFLAMVAHELRTPLAPVRTGIEILKQGSLGTEQASGVIATLERQVVQMVRLIDDLLDISRITSGKLNLNKVFVDLDEVVHHAVETVRPLLDQFGHEFTLTPAAVPIRVWGDATRLVQVISNLLNNAAKFTPPGGRIQLTLIAKPEEVVISVQDNGEGIDPEMQDRIFEMFGQIQREDRLAQGLGVGLSLVRSLVVKHGGTIGVRSEGIGSGSEFIVRIPRFVDMPSSPLEDRVPPKISLALPPAKELRKVLVVDDGAAAADLLAMFFRMEGFTALTAYSGATALEIFEKDQPDIIFSDVGMPEMDGHELARRIRKTEHGKDVILVALTGWGQDVDRQKSKDAGFDYHLTKPVDPKMLRNFLQSCDPSAGSPPAN